MALQVLWHCHKPLSSVLFSVAPRYPKYAISVSALSHVRQKPIPWAALQKASMFDARFSVLFFSQGRSHSWALSPSCSKLCPFLSAVLQVLWCCHKLLNSFLFSAAPRHPRNAVPHQCSELGKTETTLLGSPPKSQRTDVRSTVLSPFQGKSYK